MVCMYGMCAFAANRLRFLRQVGRMQPRFICFYYFDGAFDFTSSGPKTKQGNDTFLLFIKINRILSICAPLLSFFSRVHLEVAAYKGDRSLRNVFIDSFA